MQKPFHVSEGHVSVVSDLKENHFDSNAPGSSLEASQRNPDQILKEEDVDEDMFIFPDKYNSPEEQEIAKEDMNDVLKTT